MGRKIRMEWKRKLGMFIRICLKGFGDWMLELGKMGIRGDFEVVDLDDSLGGGWVGRLLLIEIENIG